MNQMTITYEEATMAEQIEAWSEQETPEVAGNCADSHEAYLILNQVAPGWRYEGNGTWAGEARKDIVSDIMTIMVEAADYVIEHLDEIRADAA